MTRLPEGGLPGQSRRNTNQAPGVRLEGLTETLRAPGVASLPPVSEGSRKAGQLLAAFGLTGQLAGQVAQLSDRERREIERANAQAAGQYRGQALLDVRTDLPELQQRIEAGELDALIETEGSIADAVDSHIWQQLTDEKGELTVPKQYADAYRRALLPNFTDAVVNRQAGMIDAAKMESLQLDAEAAVGAESSDEIRLALQSSRNYAPGLTDSQRLDAVVAPALRAAAEAGDVQRFDSAVEVLGGRFPSLVADLRRDMAEARQRDQARQQTRINDDLAQATAAELNKPTPNFERAREIVAEFNADPLTQRQAIGAIDTAQRRRDGEREAQGRQIVEDRVAALSRQGVDAPTFRQQLGTVAVEAGIEQTAVDGIAEQYTQQQIELAAQQGDVAQVDTLAGYLSNAPQVQTFLTTQRQEAVERYRGNTTSRLIGQAFEQPAAAPTIIGQAQARLRAFNANPADPNGLRPEQFQQVLNATVRESVKVTQRQLEVSTLKGLYAASARQVIDPSEPTPPQAQVSRESVLQVWGEAGVAEVNSDATGERSVLLRVTNPEQAAALTHLAGGVPAAGWYEQIGSGFDLHNNAEAVEGSQLMESARSLVALHRQNPALAQEVIRTHIDTDAGRQRADQLLELADQRVGSLARPMTEAEMIAPDVDPIVGATTLREDVVDELAAVVKTVGATQPVQIDDKTITTVLTQDGGTTLDSLADSNLKDNLPDGFKPTLGILFGRRFDLGRDTDFGPVQTEVRDEYKRNLIDAFRSRKAMGESDQAASKNAQVVAAARTMSAYPPIQWADEIVFTRGGALVPNFDTIARDRLNDLHDAGDLDVGAGAVFTNYVPRWNENAGGWLLVSRMNAEVPLLNNNGNPVMFRPGAATREALQNHIDGLLNDVDEIQKANAEKNIKDAATTRLIFMPGL